MKFKKLLFLLIRLLLGLSSSAPSFASDVKTDRLCPNQKKQWAAEGPLAQEISTTLAKHPEYCDEIHAQIGGIFQL